MSRRFSDEKWEADKASGRFPKRYFDGLSPAFWAKIDKSDRDHVNAIKETARVKAVNDKAFLERNPRFYKQVDTPPLWADFARIKAWLNGSERGR